MSTISRQLFSVLLTHLMLSSACCNAQPHPSSSAFSSILQSAVKSPDDVSTALRTEHVCSNIEIRNKIPEFKKLNNCTVIEGYLKIFLVEYTDESEFRHLSYPKLREITGYLLLYRVYGIRSLGTLFPNLTVIRGQVLFFNYALVLFELADIEELGLSSLTRIVRGGVRMEKNSQLCYIATIDWSKLVSVKMEVNFILQNKDIDECVDVCPKNPDGSALCPTIEVTLINEEKGKQELCWNADNCQKVCPPAARCQNNTCYRTNVSGVWETRCCHPECMGGCTGPLDTDCIACTNVFHKGRCLPNCPENTFKFLDRRCLLESECRSLIQNSQRTQNWKMHDGNCVEECATGYTESKEDRNRCEKCQGHCPKVCNGLIIDNVAAAQKLKGCTIIDGVLEIQIRGGSSLGSELEDNLGMIEEITQYLKIVRSYALMSLRFLKNLRVIHGKRLNAERYSLFVFDNHNLQDLWDFDKHPNMTIKNGSLFFHFNRKLCLKKIERLVDFVGKRNQYDAQDISPDSNGDQVACELEALVLDLMNVETNYAIIKWNNFKTNDPRELLSWVVNYRKTNEENITMFSTRDACGTDVWKSFDVKPDTDPNASYVASILHSLEPFTKYAVYVQTYTIATAKIGAMSKIIYFTTKADMPSPIRDITVDAMYPGELQVSWKEPATPNGNVTHYYVYWQPQSLAAEKFHQRNYCKDKLKLPSKAKQPMIIANEKNSTNDKPCCDCPKSKAQIIVEESERRYQIEFENFLHNVLYRKANFPAFSIPSSVRKRKKRYSLNESDIHNFAKKNPDSYRNLLRNNSELPNITMHGVMEGPESFPLETHEAAIVYGKTEITITNLRHFQEYSIEVIACHEYIKGIDDKLCSNRAIISGRTLANTSADSVDQKNITVSNDTREGEFSNVLFTWKEPTAPNGLVVLYEIELVRTEVTNYNPDILCIPHQQYISNKGSHLVQNLKPGSWTFRLRVTSLAGSGPWTEPQEFYVTRIETVPGAFNLPLIVGVVVAMFVSITVIAIIVAYVVRNRINELNEDALKIVTYNPNYDHAKEYEPDEWEVDREKIEIVRELGQGSFGMVYEGIAHDLIESEELLRVAIKTVNVEAPINDRYSFLNEASIMKAFNSYHVVKLLGVVSKGQPVLVVMELMLNGDLKTYLRLLRPDEPDKFNDLEPPTLADILKWAGEIADGMAYLSSIKYAHRDLAARNCMVSADLVVKIGDFGMTRDIYTTDYYRKDTKGLLPVRWMAPESLKDGIFTSRSDVWSYGVVLWEMATLAAQPYQGLSNEQILHYVIEGSIMERPDGCPMRLYKMMVACWKMNPKERPTFYDIIEELSLDLPQSFRENSFYFSQQVSDGDGYDDFTSVDSIVNNNKDTGIDDDNDDLDLIHSKTPLHPTKSSLFDLSIDSRFTEGDPKPDMIMSSRGFPMPVQLQSSAEVVPTPSLHRRVSGSISAMDNKTSLSDIDLRETGGSMIVHVTPKPPHYRRDNSIETTNDSLSSSGVNVTTNRSLGGITNSQPDVVRGGPVEKGNSHLRGMPKNGLVNGVALPPYSSLC